MFIIWLFFLLFWSGTEFELLLTIICTFGRSISKRARKFSRFSLTHVVSVAFQISQSEWMFESNFQFVLLLGSLIGFSASYLTALKDVSAFGNQRGLLFWVEGHDWLTRRVCTAQEPHSKILMTGGSDRGSYFIPKEITTSEFVYPKKSLLFLAYPKKFLSSFFATQKTPSVLF